MPVVRCITNYMLSCGTVRRVRLYAVWRTLQARKATGEWTWPTFRAWALSSGYRRGAVLKRRNPLAPHGWRNSFWGTNNGPCRARVAGQLRRRAAERVGAFA